MITTKNIFCGIVFITSFVLFSGVKQINAKVSVKGETKNIIKNGLTNFQKPYGSWFVKNKQLILGEENPQKNRTNIWINEDFEDFILELDFKVNQGTNSGVFFRTKNINDPVQTGIEVQIRDDYGKCPIDKHFCGSVYEIKEISENRVKKAGGWNRLKIVCKNTLVRVYLNKGKVIEMDLSEWDEVGKNPDGSKNKFKTAFKDMPSKGKIGFQDHGGKVWFKNIRIKEL